MLADLQVRIADLVRDESGRIGPDETGRAVTAALARYSSDRPRQVVEDVVGGGDTLPLPASWGAGSMLLTAEYPVGRMPPSPLACSLYTLPVGQVLRLGESLPVGAVVRLGYTLPHVCSDTLDTVPADDLDAVAAWAASLLLDQLAAASINDSDSTLGADSTNRRSKSGEYARQAKLLRERYLDATGQADSQGSGHGASGVAVSWGQRPRFRPRKAV